MYCGTEADIWSCGVILYALVAGFLPFDENRMNDLFRKIKDADFVTPHTFSNELCDLIHRMLEPNAIKRIKVKEIF